MINKVYETIKKFLKENIKFLICLLIVFIISITSLPYYINTPGGLIDIDNRIVMKNKKDTSGSFNMAYVSEIHATLPLLIYANFNKNWDILKEEELKYDNESIKDVEYRDKIMLKEAGNNAILVAFHKANKPYKIKANHVVVTYVDAESKTDLEVGDTILKADGIPIDHADELRKMIQEKKDGEKLELTILRDKVEIKKSATVTLKEGIKLIGILLASDLDLETTPKVSLQYTSSESGPSGGLMTALAIYNELIEQDLTKGHTIVGTGTIDLDGNVGAIGGVKYKILGAEKKKAEIFIVPNGENYEEAMKLKKEKKLKIKIVGVSTFDEAVAYLENL